MKLSLLEGALTDFLKQLTDSFHWLAADKCIFPEQYFLLSMCRTQTRHVCQINIFYICTQIFNFIIIASQQLWNEFGRDNFL